MYKMRIAGVILVCVCLLAGVLGLGFTRVSAAGDNVVKYRKYADEKNYKVGDISYEAADVDKVVIHWSAGKVKVIHKEQDQLSISEAGRDLSESQKMHYLFDGKTLYIEYCESEYKGTIKSSSKNLVMEIPKGISVEINSLAADFELDTLELNTLVVESQAGNLRADKISANDISVNSAAGDIYLGLADETTVFVETASGNVDIKNYAECGGVYSVETLYGVIKADKKTVKKGSYTYGDGKSFISVTSASGDISFTTNE